MGCVPILIYKRGGENNNERSELLQNKGLKTKRSDKWFNYKDSSK